MDLILKHPGTCVMLLFALALLARVSKNLAEPKNLFPFLLGALLMALGLLDLLGVIILSQKWVLACSSAIWGLFFVIIGIGTLRSPANPAKWASWAAVVIGMGGIVMTFVIIFVPPFS